VNSEPTFTVVLGPYEVGVLGGANTLGAKDVWIAVLVKIIDYSNIAQRLSNGGLLPLAGQDTGILPLPTTGNQVLVTIAVHIRALYKYGTIRQICNRMPLPFI